MLIAGGSEEPDGSEATCSGWGAVALGADDSWAGADDCRWAGAGVAGVERVEWKITRPVLIAITTASPAAMSHS